MQGRQASKDVVAIQAGVRVIDALREREFPLRGPQGVAIVRTLHDDQQRDLDWSPSADTEVEVVRFGSDPGLAVVRHSTTHILAQAVQNLFPKARLGNGPATADGFYYDFLVDEPFQAEDLEVIDAEMRRLIAEKQDFRRRLAGDLEQVEQELQDEPLKLELVHDRVWDFDESDRYGETKLSIYDNVVDDDLRWKDLCRGPHVADTSALGVFSLTHTAAAYWRGDEHRPQLQRIYGTAFLDRKSLKAHLAEREERLKRDHRRLGEELNLFAFDQRVGKGLPLWLPNGTAVRDELEKWAREVERKQGYRRVVTPHLTKEDLYYLSGHLPYYQDDLYAPIDIEEERYYLRPMNCPHHHAVYAARPHSYRDLPYKIAEYGTVYRFERSGQLHGLMRARGFTQNDAHIYCTREQAENQFLEVMQLHEYYYRALGLENFHMVLAVRDPANKEKYHDDEEMWRDAEDITRSAMERSGIPYVLDVGGAAHYGPKVDFIVRAVTGKEFAASTNQVDLYTPRRFGLQYKDAQGEDQPVVVLHRAPLGSHERFVAFLTEEYGGNFPFWLAPEQLVVVPISENQYDAAAELAAMFFAADFRAEADLSDSRMQAKIRNSTLRRVPAALVLGAREVEAGEVALRLRSGREWRAPTEEVLALLTRARDKRVLDLAALIPGD